MEESLHIGPDIQQIIRSLEYEDAEALLNDLLADSERICRKSIERMQQETQAEYDRLIVDEMKATPELSPAKAQEEAEWRLRTVLRALRERLLTYGVQQREVQRQRDRRIIEWVRSRMTDAIR